MLYRSRLIAKWVPTDGDCTSVSSTQSSNEALCYRVGVPTKSKWFCDIYMNRTSKIKIFLTPGDPPISSETASFIARKGSTSLAAKAAAAAAASTVSNENIFDQLRRTREKLTCAVVGNSANLLNSRCGPVIDQNDVVIRMNAAATKGYEKDVGSRTTFQSLYQRIEKEYKKPNKVLLVSVHTKELRWAARAAGNLHLTPSDVYLVHPAFVRAVTMEVLGEKKATITSGALLLTLAVHLCNEVNVFGFGRNEKGLYSHYDREIAPERALKIVSFHPLKEEEEYRNKLVEGGIIRVYKGKTNSSSLCE
ncbi:CMP-N-acetylneuraminate-beta-galactosamide-alpha-2,3-sialyltransferase 1-like [Oscarella lobularis]|uniref:CMP-N-acetylneuraminate-beta-galactosamide- alpha-2,3-sialyltransferase 1-like n=1 Tax=Oscarella lobularis TaxID=121494 RepID=UPI0033143853